MESSDLVFGITIVVRLSLYILVSEIFSCAKVVKYMLDRFSIVDRIVEAVCVVVCVVLYICGCVTGFG